MSAQEVAALLATGLAAGFVAGSASCTAVQGGLLAGLARGRERGGPRWAVGWFLAGRLAAYSAVGALLGLAGEAVTLGPTTRAVLLLAAGVLVVAFAVRLLRRTDTSRPDTSHTDAGRTGTNRTDTSRTGTNRAEARCADGGCAPERGAVARLGARLTSPPLLGAATVLVPCGVTLSMEMIAVTSRSAAGGAAVLAGFVVGSSPAFALLGYVLRRLSRTRVARLTGVAALAAGLWTVGTGLNLGGWLPRPTPPAAAVTGRDTAARPPTVTIWAMRDGYRPGYAKLPAGVPVEIVFRPAEQGCTGTVTIAGRDVALPATVRLPAQRPGTLRYVCGMGMYTGFLNFS
ncbi:sulfite exporter TauE/SafE [Nonomuraea muscovyensis]|uniref:Sulfite exporter TauE/SafE n=1 Tax=Nonomuraea muscovyensis TaxID=1124761 RepID=A0A7X0F0F8_9ACTN|nr:sulfite exporter TauE/SafE family protein [Nonomuraea muscovyensis]MBB6350868.1 sulfite exporter TauE/SafE [Nonomuraea muscovyensis]